MFNLILDIHIRSYYGQVTAVKTAYALTSVTLPVSQAQVLTH